MRQQSGNVLFLILVAVALFAALSFSVLNSSRSGGADAGSETNLVQSAAIMEYPLTVRTGVIRMMITDSLDLTDLEFNIPTSNLAACTNSGANCVYHPDGGAVPFVQPLDSALAVGGQKMWIFVNTLEVENIGTTVDSSFDGNDIVGVIIGLKKSICDRIHEELGLGAVPVSTLSVGAWFSVIASGIMYNGWSPPAYETVIGTIDSNGTDSLLGQPEGCFATSGASPYYLYYHVIVER